jgi:pimeloyl-ACP methyl ester carboxylesterase
VDRTGAERSDTPILDRIAASRADVPAVPARLLRELPVGGRWVALNGTATFLLEGGRGPTTVLLHGGIPTGGVYWARMIRRLADERHLVVPDVPGQGISDAVARLDPTTFADWLAELVRVTCHEKPTLIAHSLVGGLAARFAAQHDALVGGLILTGAPALGRWRPPLAFVMAALLSSLRPSARSTQRFARWAFHDLDRTRQTDPEWFDAFFAYMRARGIDPHVKRTTRQLVRRGTTEIPTDELRRIAAPTALVWGRHDRMAPLDLAEAASARTGWPLHVIDDAGHVPFVEQPDAFAAALADVELRIGISKPTTRRSRDG